MMVSSFSRAKSLSSLWCLTIPSSAAYASGAMSNSMCTLWLMILSLGALGVLGDSLLFLLCTAKPFSSMGPFSSSPLRTNDISQLLTGTIQNSPSNSSALNLIINTKSFVSFTWNTYHSIVVKT